MKVGKTFVTEKLSLLQRRPRLAVTMGDPAGIGSEAILKALADSEVITECEITVIGTRSLLQTTYTQLQQQTQERGERLADPDELSILDIELDPVTQSQITAGVGNAASGAASFAYLEAAITHTLAGEFDGIVTAPIAKSLWKAAGHDYPGQTEVLAAYAGVERFGMLFVARSPHSNWFLRTLLATTHIPLRQVPDTLTPELMSKKLDLLVECLRVDFGLETPRIAISGLNPHSGEQGQLGREEQDWLIPWLEQERQQRPRLCLDGPVPPDTLWVKPARSWYGVAPHNEAHDAYLALYHDQGLIPVKLLAFDRAVNTTIGLPFVRTSPDHGTAFDIAGQGIANATSMKAAIQLAAKLLDWRLSVQV
jgi:4-hydroxythreonine-4-phosphate dehydrogenase